MFDQLLSRYLRWFNARHMRLQPTAGRLPEARPDKRYLLYMHVPFCESLCPFCSFHRVRFEAPRAQRYFAALRRELQLYHDRGFKFSDVYVGGGTPTVLPDELCRTLDLARVLFDIEGISVETNPNHLRPEVTEALAQSGVTRLSVGVQSLEDRLLEEMGRQAAYGSASQIMERLAATQGQFDTFNVDMIFNIPHQSEASLRHDLELLKGLEIDQISYYPLMPSTTTEKAMSRDMGQVEFGRERGMYELIRDILTPDYAAGSAWCFSRSRGAIDEYIVDHDEYLGIGSGSFSYLDGATWSSTFSINRYLDLVESGCAGLTASRALSRKEQAQYDFLMQLFGLRMDKAALQSKYGGSYRRLLWKELAVFRLMGAIRETERDFRLTPRGMYYWVLMMREFFTGVNNFRAQMRHQVRQEWQPLLRPAKVDAHASVNSVGCKS